MKTVDLSFVMRVKVGSVLALATGQLAKIAALQAVYEQVRFNEEELALLTVEDVDTAKGVKSFHTDAPEKFRKICQVEDSHAAMLERELNEFQGFTLGDIEWAEAIKRQLHAAPMPAMKFKTRGKK